MISKVKSQLIEEANVLRNSATATEDVVGRALRLQPGGSQLYPPLRRTPAAARLPYNDFFLIGRGLLRRLGTAVVALANQNDAADTDLERPLQNWRLQTRARKIVRCPVDAPDRWRKGLRGRTSLCCYSCRKLTPG